MDIDAGSKGRRWRAAFAALIAFGIVIVGAEWALPGIELAPLHAPHALIATGVGEETSIAVDHPHFSKGGAALSPEAITEAVVPRGIVSLVALGLVTAVAVLTALWRQTTLAATRGPPRTPIALSGRDLLTRMCIARR